MKKFAPPRRRTRLDASPFRRQVKQILRDGIEQLEYGYEEDPFTDELLAVLKRAQEFAETGDGNSAIAILEAITSAYAQEWDELLNYGADCYTITDDLDRVWTEAILCAELTEPEAIDLREMLETWQEELDADFEMSLEALRQSWSYPPLLQVLEAQHLESGIWSGNRPSFADRLALIRLKILERQQRHQEYLFLAKAEGLTEQYLTKLAASGRIDDAMTTAKTQMKTNETAFALAQTLREVGHLQAALEIASTGLTLPGNCCYDLATWTSELAEGLGNSHVALDASIIAFTTKPSFVGYRWVERLAGKDWSKVKQNLLQTLHRYQEWGAEDAKVNIFLHEGLLDEAIAVVQTASGNGTKLRGNV